MRLDILIAVAEKGGVENVVNNTIPYLQQQGIMVRIVQVIWEGESWADDEIPFYHLIDERDVSTGRDMINAYKEFLQNTYVPDTILATAWPLMSRVGKKAVSELDCTDVTIISWLHHAPIINYERSKFGGFEDLKMADGHIAISEKIYDEIKGNIPDAFVCRVHNPVDIKKYSCKVRTTADNVYKLCYVGRISPEKRLDLIIKALEKLGTAYELFIIGADSDTYADSMKMLALELGVANNITWYGWQQEPWHIAQKADVVIMSSDAEGFPLVAIEALANGLPVLTTPVSGVKELICDGENGYMYPFGDYESLACMIKDINEGKKALPASDICRQSVQQYEFHTAVKEFHEKINELIAGIEEPKAINHAKRQKQAVSEWNKRYLEAEKRYISRVDALIKEGTPDAYEKICEMFEGTEGMSEEEMIATGKIPLAVFRGRTEMSYLIQAVNIYYREQATGEAVTVFDHGNSLQDIIDVMNQVRFLLWELEFFKSDEALVGYLKSNKISAQMLSYLAEPCLKELRKMIADNCYERTDRELNRHAGKKVAFILCVNNDVYMQEALYFINKLEVPYGCEVEILTIQDAKSMTGGYNEGMNASDAKYKVYLHQDVFIVNPYFIYDILDIFENPDVGMIGAVGFAKVCGFAMDQVLGFWKETGKTYSANAYGTSLCKFGEMSAEYESVQVVDGMLMVTQYDIPWREDLFDKWDMYDMSQSIEFRRAGYDVVIPNVKLPWCLHDEGFVNMVHYYEELDKLKREYYLN
ncbi:MAG: glycosyltransferase [Muribaculaceae bacterium]|nr:glycosyltransferase [Muribaculaceae bacterium]MCM1398941.1 glycosyltransferase [Clostridium sp.]MCM1458799.1 glycosyltransferase [Bacteroides sp.]